MPASIPRHGGAGLRSILPSIPQQTVKACRAHAHRFGWDRVTGQFRGHVAPLYGQEVSSTVA